MARQPRRTLRQRSDQLGDLHGNDINIDTREVFAVSYFDAETEDEPGIDFRMAALLLKNLTFLDSISHKPILLHCCSDGGDWNYGMAMFDAIRMIHSSVVTLSHAHATSMSSIIPQAAERRVIMPNADFMFHFGLNGFDGDERSFIAHGEKAKEIDARMVDIYAAKCARGPYFRRNRLSRDRVRRWLVEQMNVKREVYLRPAEAVDYGFMDGVFGQPGFRTLDDLRKGL
jgi:ATP-dependent protease ClpP protease subunit